MVVKLGDPHLTSEGRMRNQVIPPLGPSRTEKTQ